MSIYVVREGKLVEVERARPRPRVHIITDKAYENLTPVITSMKTDADGNVQVEQRDISTRQRHRDYMRENGLALFDDFKPEWEAAAKEREAIVTGAHDEAELRETMERAAYRVFDAPGIEERPSRPSADDDGALKGAPGEIGYDPQADRSYPVVNK